MKKENKKKSEVFHTHGRKVSVSFGRGQHCMGYSVPACTRSCSLDARLLGSCLRAGYRLKGPEAAATMNQGMIPSLGTQAKWIYILSCAISAPHFITIAFPSSTCLCEYGMHQNFRLFSPLPQCNIPGQRLTKHCPSVIDCIYMK